MGQTKVTPKRETVRLGYILKAASYEKKKSHERNANFKTDMLIKCSGY
jgi:hypothetical protein